ncbi:UDP-N-acetylmuramoyl-tripeptide--D-alanyl-D-alanine ligase [Parasphingorhabdus marina DSM 22363]|uniref:UDP-N-acetylmuramoyl-tripeptide--D-alanyl-D-alanine ligase n=2 Tax=Parasphingorhabdus marina TaxID=394732 RepID=A0A1N6GUB7_9SPHN|nr:UDP-N-acetylmuramoyl-tripeptide--D-alanyl-D-alanine ligase [Parasphingorhabdus marina DSM 22363]
MALWTSSEIADAVGGTIHGDFQVNGVAFDSREVGEGDLFIALKGEQSDGHLYIDKAIKAGASGVLVSEAVDGPHVRVTDTAVALDKLGIGSRARTGAKIIGVTGSVGKTGVKEALFAALNRSSLGKAHRSLKSYNNHVGVPLSLSRMPRDSQFGIFEMGMNHSGELSALTRLVRPHAAIVTTIAPAHIGHFPDEEAIADAKGEIFEGLEKDGTAIVPFDNRHYQRLRDKAASHCENIVSFGLQEGADVRAVDVVPAPGGGSLVTAKLGDQSLCFTISMPGEHWVSNALAILAAVQAVGGDLASAGLALAELEGLAGRGQRHNLQLKDGGSALLIDESYNANPVSMKATLVQMAEEACEGRRIAILGAMGELGDRSQHYHEALADDIFASGVAQVILVGDEMAHTAARLKQEAAASLDNPLEISHVASAADALSEVAEILGDGDILLVKGSNYLGLASTVSGLVSGEY